MTKTATLVSTALLIAVGSVSAQYVGPGVKPPFTSISEILRSAPDDARADVEGYIIKKVGKEKYLFSDGQDQIRIEIEAEDFPNVKIDEKARVRIRGEVEKDFLESPEIDVDRVDVL